MDIKKLTEYAQQQRQADNTTGRHSGVEDINNDDAEIYIPINDEENEPEPIPDICLETEDAAENRKQHLMELKISEKVRIIGITGTDYAGDLGIPTEQAETYVRMNDLIPEFLAMLDNGSMQVTEAEILAGIKQSSQMLIYQTVTGNELKITAKSAAELAKAKRLTEESIIKALKPKPAPRITLPAEIAEKYFHDMTANEAVETIKLALEAYVKN